MSDDQEKKYTTEWSFSFADLGDQISGFIKSFGEGESGEETIKSQEFSAPLGDTVKSARVRLDLPVAETEIKATGGSENLLEATVTYIGEINFATSGADGEEMDVHLSQGAAPGDWLRHVFGWVGNREHLVWKIALNPAVPTDLDINGGVGESTFDLRDLLLTNLQIDGGTGATELTLPVKGEGYTSVINGGVGQFTVTALADTDSVTKIRVGTGEFKFDIEQNANISTEIRGGLGAFHVSIPADAEVKLEARMGIGDIKVPPRMAQVGADDGSNPVGQRGVWQTVGYDTAERKITITFEGGVGELQIQSVP